MKIEFLKRFETPNMYVLVKNNEPIFKAFYDRRTEMKLLYSIDDKLIAQGFPFYTKKLQLIGDYMIQLLDEYPAEILVSNKSFFFQTKKFSFKNSDYTIFQHIGTRYSIFKGRQQVASYQTYDFTSGSERMILICDDNLCKKLFCLLSLYLYADFGNEGTIPNASFNLWFQARKYDKNWKPNTNSYL